MLVVGNYSMGLRFGGIEVPISPQMIHSISVTLDVDRVLPTFKIALKDATGILGEIAPYDKTLNSIDLQFGRSDNPERFNTFKLAVKRRKPDSDRNYTIEGVLDVPNLLTTVYKRALTGDVKTSIETLATVDMQMTKTEVGASLSYNKTFIQPRWTDAKLLNYLSDNLIGRNGETGYHCFVKNVDGEQILVFKSLDEMLSSAVKFGFIVAPKPYKDLYPVVEYRVFDNSQLLVDLGAKTQDYGYFNYDTGAFVESTIDAVDCPALGERTLIDDDNSNNSVFITGLGRSNDFTIDFGGRISSNYYKRVNNFVNIWISTWGMENASPGDIVRLLFGEALARGQLFQYHLSGYWMISRVVHLLGSSYMTNLLLTRNGIDTNFSTSLIKAENLKRK